MMAMGLELSLKRLDLLLAGHGDHVALDDVDDGDGSKCGDAAVLVA